MTMAVESLRNITVLQQSRQLGRRYSAEAAPPEMVKHAPAEDGLRV